MNASSVLDALELRPGVQPSPRLLILGGGALVGELYIPALIRLGWEQQVLIVEKEPRSVAVMRQRFPSIRAMAADYHDIASSPLAGQFDGAVIALPNCHHEDAVTRCLQAGLHVLCEKPLALEGSICSRLAAVAHEAGRTLSVAMVRRLIPSVVAIREAIGVGFLGDVVEVDIEHGGKFTWPADSGTYFRRENGGLLVNMGIHYLDMVEHWVGALNPTEYWDDYEGGVEANVRYKLESSRGTKVRLTLSYTHELKNRFVIRGRLGEITSSVNQFASCSWRLKSSLEGSLQPSAPFTRGDWPPDFVSAFAEQFSEFGSVIRGSKQPTVDASHAAKIQMLIDWAYDNRKPWYPVRTPAVRPRPTLAPKPTLVTGGSGFLGENLVARLHELNFTDIKIPLRSHRSGAGVARLPVERVLTDLRNYESVRKSVRGASYVFHLAYGNSGQDSSAVTIEGAKNVIEAAISERVEAVVVVSTASVFGRPPGNAPVTEIFPYRRLSGGLGDYSRAKTAAERYCLIRAKSSLPTRIVVLNPSAIYGPGGTMFTEFPVRASHNGLFCWIEQGRGRLNYTYVDNVVDALVLAAQCGEAHGQRFIINDGVCSFRKFLTPILGPWATNLPSYTLEELDKLNRRGRTGLADVLRVLAGEEMMRIVNDAPVLSTVKNLIEKKAGVVYQKAQAARRAFLTDQNPVQSIMPPAWLGDLYGPFEIEYSASKAEKTLGWSPLVSLEQGQRTSVKWLQRLGLLPASVE